MSFAIWNEKPKDSEALMWAADNMTRDLEPDEEGKFTIPPGRVLGQWTGEGFNPGERIYAREGGTWKHHSEVQSPDQVDLWCVSSEGSPDPARVDAMMNPVPQKTQMRKLADMLAANGSITPEQAATFDQAPAPDGVKGK